ncbi:MAG: hypothetical protein C4523_11335 [Myxococcales bacterium]|nr:MAG: hypothetical protein C4523_11335 [Myxococcales bacterium]
MIQQAVYLAKSQGNIWTLSGTTVAAAYSSPVPINVSGTDYYLIPFPDGHVFSSATAKATEEYVPDANFAYNGVNPELPRKGPNPNISWASNTATSNMKVNWDLGTTRTLHALYVENYAGNAGIRDFTLYCTDSATAFANTTYADTTDLTALGTFTAANDPSDNTETPQVFVLGSPGTCRYLVMRIATNGGSVSYMGFYHAQAMSTAVQTSYTILTPGVDYGVRRGAVSGAQTLNFSLLKPGTFDIVIDYF